MRMNHFLTGIPCLLLGMAVSAQQTAPSAVMGVSYQEPASGGLVVSLNVDEASGPLCFVQVSADNFASSFMVGPFPLDQEGNVLVSGKIDPTPLPSHLGLQFRAVYMGDKTLQWTDTVRLVLNDDGCDTMDVDLGAGAVPMLAGALATEQWAPIGMHLSATSQLPTVQPNKAIFFDTAHPTGGDDDLATPGYGPGNDKAYGMMLVVAENDIDANNDGYIDEPDDAYNGGLIHFNFDQPQTICSVVLVDIDDSEPNTGITKLRFYADNAGTQQISAVTVLPQGDNSVQTVFVRVFGVLRMDVKMGGSGGVPEISMCPTVVNFDQNTFGVPMDFTPGEVVTTQYAGVGLTIWADNARPGGPDKAIIFDSGNPTGGDFDLKTPGYGPDNNVFEGKILIIAENVVDLNQDGLVDDPDDEAQGGWIYFDFDMPVRVGELTVLDVDTYESSYVECRDENNLMVESAPLHNMGDNSRQVMHMQANTVRRLVVRFGGSGSVTNLRFCPTP